MRTEPLELAKELSGGGRMRIIFIVTSQVTGLKILLINKLHQKVKEKRRKERKRVGQLALATTQIKHFKDTT